MGFVMGGKLRRLYRHLRDTVRMLFRRLRSHGLNSAWISIRCNVANFFFRQRNKRGNKRVECPCCKFQGYDFYHQDTITFWMPSVTCPKCGSHERQRMLYLFLEREDPGFFERGGKMLHLAPEKSVRDLIDRNTGYRCISSDYSRGALSNTQGPRFCGDLQHFCLADDSVDGLFCLHVLEHVRKDKQAVGELHRVLKPGGVAYIMVPFDMELDETEEWAEADPDMWGHIWAYSQKDFKPRLAPFEFKEVYPESFLTPEEVERFRVPRKEVIYRCVKR